MRRFAALLVTIALAALLSFAFAAPELTPQQEARAQAVGKVLRCPVCRGLPITESPNDLSTQMMAVVREQVAAGRSDQEILAFFASRYGESVLLRPPARGANLALWGLPVIALAGGAFLLARWLRAASRVSGTADPHLLARVEQDLHGEDSSARRGPS